MLLTRSTLIPSLTLAVALFAVLSSLTSECQAQQRRFVPFQEINRFLGVFQGAGYHCANPGQNTDYYNPYSAHNSRLVYPNEPARGVGQGYMLFDADSVPHSSYTGRDQSQHSVFESLPGQTVQPNFEPAVDRTKKKQDTDFDSNLDFDADSDFEADSDFDSDFDEPSTLKTKDSFDSDEMESEDLASEGDGGFDTLKENFDDIQDKNELPPNPDAFGEDGFLN